MIYLSSSCVQMLDYFPKAISYSTNGDLYIVAVKNEEMRIGDLESGMERRDEILKLTSFKGKLEKYHSTGDSGSWISDLSILQNGDILIW